MPATITEIVTAAQELIGEVAGVGVQTYGESLMVSHAIRGFNLMHSKYPWDEYLEWKQLVLDGSTGRFTTNNDFDDVREFGDFLWLSPTGSTRQIPLLNRRENPYVYSGSGTPLRFTSVKITDANWQAKRLQFYPLTATGTIDCQVRIYPVDVDENLVAGTIVHLDFDLLTYATAFQALAFDDTNANAFETVKNMLEMRYNDLTANRASMPMAVSRSSGIPTDWTECR